MNDGKLLTQDETRAMATAIDYLLNDDPVFLFGARVQVTFPDGLPCGITIDDMKMLVKAYSR